MSAQVVEDDIPERYRDPGMVRPAFVHRPPRVSSLARPLATLAEALGRPLDPEQYLATDVLTGERADGRPASLMACAIGARQNFKTWTLELILLGRMLRECGGDRLAVWSAHEVRTSQATFRDILGLIEEHKWLRRRVRKVRQTNGREGIDFVNGAVDFRARIKTGGRGLSGDALYLDEAFALQPEHMGALLPILSTRRRAAVFLGSSAGLDSSAILRNIRDQGRAGGPGAPAYVEFCAPGSFAEPGCELDDCDHEPFRRRGCSLDREDYWLLANPAARVGRITMEYLRDERAALPPEEFARERLGWWSDPTGAAKLTEALWTSLADPGSKPQPQPVGLALDTSKGLRSAVVAACGRRPDGRAHVEVLRVDAGVDWLEEFLLSLARLNAPVGLLGGSATAQAVVPMLTRARVRFEEIAQGDYAAACGLLVSDATDDRLRHLGDPVLGRAVEVVTSVPVGDGGAFRWSAAKSGGDITPLVAATLARWQLEKSPGSASSVF